MCKVACKVTFIYTTLKAKHTNQNLTQEGLFMHSTEENDRKLKQAPLIYVLSQVQFSDILTIAKSVPDFQEAIRFAYPLFSQEVVQIMQIGPNNLPQQVEQHQWVFSNKDNSAAFILSSASLVFHTTAYTTYSDFISQVTLGLELLSQVVDVNLITRLGLRYVDVITPSTGKSFDSYLVPGLAGHPFSDFVEDRVHFHTEAVEKTSIGQLIVKSVQFTNSNAILPGDLIPLSLTVARSDFLEPSKRAIIDFDHFISDLNEDFSLDRVIGNFDKLHDISSKAFWATITKEAIQEWT